MITEINVPRLKSLLELAGANTDPATLQTAALLIIDAQREYVTGALPLTGMEAAIAEAAVLLALARAASTPIIHLAHHGSARGRLFDPEGAMVEFVPELLPRQNETIIIKHMPNSFVGTDLLRSLEANGRRDLILCGFMTHNCVGATARAAVDLGFRVTIVENATATRDLADSRGRRIDAALVQRVALAELADRFAVVVPSAKSFAMA